MKKDQTDRKKEQLIPNSERIDKSFAALPGRRILMDKTLAYGHELSLLETLHKENGYIKESDG